MGVRSPFKPRPSDTTALTPFGDPSTGLVDHGLGEAYEVVAAVAAQLPALLYLASLEYGTFALATHNHDAKYQLKGNYALADHNHLDEYQKIGDYAAEDHNHDERYVLKSDEVPDHVHDQYVNSAQVAQALAFKADSLDLANLTTQVGNKADAAAVTALLGFKADLVGGKVPASQLPAQGPSLPTGGTLNQVLTKNSATDGDASWKTPASGNGLGLPTYLSTSRWVNPYSIGDRRGVVTVDRSAGATGDANHWVRAELNNTWYWNNGGSGQSVTLTFPEAVRIDGFKFVQDVVASQGTWQVAGSNDGTTWTNLGAPIAWGTSVVTLSTFDNLGGFYTRYRLTQVTGTTASAAWQQNIQFRLANENATYGSSGTAATLIVMNNQSVSYQPVLADATFRTLIRMNAATALNLTLPADSVVNFPIGSELHVSQVGAGQVSFVAGAGATINVRGNALKIAGQHGAATAIKVAANTWLLAGDLTA
jgi:hypothetical protein